MGNAISEGGYGIHSIIKNRVDTDRSGKIDRLQELYALTKEKPAGFGTKIGDLARRFLLEAKTPEAISERNRLLADWAALDKPNRTPEEITQQQGIAELLHEVLNDPKTSDDVKTSIWDVLNENESGISPEKLKTLKDQLFPGKQITHFDANGPTYEEKMDQSGNIFTRQYGATEWKKQGPIDQSATTTPAGVSTISSSGIFKATPVEASYNPPTGLAELPSAIPTGNEYAAALQIRDSDQSTQTEVNYSKLKTAKTTADQCSAELANGAGGIAEAINANGHFLNILDEYQPGLANESDAIAVRDYVAQLKLLEEIIQLQNDTQAAIDAWRNNSVQGKELHEAAKSKYESLCQKLADYNPELYGENGANKPPDWAEMVAGVVEFKNTIELSDKVTSELEKFNDAWSDWQNDPAENNKQTVFTAYNAYYEAYGEHKPQGLETPQEIENKINDYTQTKADLETAYSNLRNELQKTPPDINKMRQAHGDYAAAYEAHWGEPPDTDDLMSSIGDIERFLQQATEFNNTEDLLARVSPAKTIFTKLWDQWKENPGNADITALQDAYKAYYNAYNGQPPAELATPAEVNRYIETGTRLHTARVNLEKALTAKPQWTPKNIGELKTTYETIYATAYRAHYGAASTVTPSFENIRGALQPANTVIINGTTLNNVKPKDAAEIRNQLKIINDNQPKYRTNDASFTEDCDTRAIAVNIKNARDEINRIVRQYPGQDNFILQLDFIFCVNMSRSSPSPAGNTIEHDANDIPLGQARCEAFIDLLTKTYVDVNLEDSLRNMKKKIFLVVDKAPNAPENKSDDYIKLELELYSNLPAIRSESESDPDSGIRRINRVLQSFNRAAADTLLANLKEEYNSVNIALANEERTDDNGLTTKIPKRGAVSVTSAGVSDQSFYNVSRNLPALELNTPPAVSAPLPQPGTHPGQPPVISGLADVNYKDLPSIKMYGVNTPNDTPPVATINLAVPPPPDPGRNIPPLCKNIEDTIALPPQTADEDQIVTEEKTYQLPITYASDMQGKPVLAGDLPEGITITDDEEISPRAWIDDDGGFHTIGLPPGVYNFTYGVQNAEGMDIGKIGDGKIAITVTQETRKTKPVGTPLNWYASGDASYNNQDGGRQQLEAGVIWNRFTGIIYYEGNNVSTVQGLVDQLVGGRIEWQAIDQTSPEGRAAVTIFGAVQYGVIDTKQEVTVNDVTYRPTDELFADGDGNTEFSVIELKDLYDRGEISKIQYEDALNRPHQAAPKSLGITAGPTIRPSDEYRLLEPTPASPQKTAAELRATGYSEDQIEAMTKVNAAGYSATETIGDEIIVVAGQSNPDITANPDAYKQVREPYGIGTVYTAKSASEAAKLAGQPGLSDAENWIITSTGNIIYSDTPVKEEDLPSGVTPGMCLQVQPDSPYDTTEFDPASKSYTEDEVKSSADSSRFGLTGNKIITNKVIGHSEQTVSSIPPGANPDDYIEVSPVYPYGNVDINASPLTVAQLAAAAPGSFGPTGAKLSTVTVQGSARPTADEHGTPYADSDCTVASWGAVDSSVAPETIDWPHTGTTGDGFKYVYNGSYPTDPPTILFENPATDSEYRTNAHYDVQEKTLPRLSIAVPQQPNSKDNIINLAFNLPEIEAAGGRVQISINNQIIHINHSPYNIKQILADNLYNANETIDITVYIVDAAGNELANSKQCTLAITSTEKNIKKGSKYNIETGPFSSAPQLWEIYEKKGTRQPLVPASWTVPVFEYKPRVQNPPTYKPPIYEEVAEYKLYVLNPTLYKAPTGETEYLYQLKAQNWIEKAPTEATYYEPQYEHFAPQQETFSVRKFERSGEETTILTGKNRDTEFTAATGMQFGVSRRVINGKVVEMTLNADGTVAYKLTNFQRENNFSMQNGESMITNSDGTYTERTVSGVPEEFTRNGGQIVYDMKAGCGIKFKEGPLEGVSLWANGIIRKDAVSAEKQVNYNMDSLEDWVSKYGGELGLSWGAGSLWNGTAVFRYLHGINGTDEFWAGLEQRFGEHFRAGVETDFQNYITARTALTFGNGWTFTGSASTDSIFENRTVADILGLQPSLSDTNDPFFKVGAGIAYSREFDNPVLTGLTLTGDISLNIPRQEFEHNYGLSLGFIPTTFGRSMFELNGSATFNNTELQDVGGKVFWNLHKNHQLFAGLTHNPGSGQNKAEVVYKLNIESKKP